MAFMLAVLTMCVIFSAGPPEQRTQVHSRNLVMEKLLESLGVDVQDENLLQKQIIRQQILNLVQFPSKNYFMIPTLSDVSSLPILSNKSSLLLLNELKSELKRYELYSEEYNKCYFKYLFFSKLYRENNYPDEEPEEDGGEVQEVRKKEQVELNEIKRDSNTMRKNERKKDGMEEEEWEEESIPRQSKRNFREEKEKNEVKTNLLSVNCPLCDESVSIGHHASIDLAVSNHIDSSCKQNNSKRKRSTRVSLPDPIPNDRISQRTRSSVSHNRIHRNTSSSRVVRHEEEKDEEEYEQEEEDDEEEEEQDVSNLRNTNMKFNRVTGSPVVDDWEDDVFYTRLLEYEMNLSTTIETAAHDEESLPVTEENAIESSSSHNDQIRARNLKSRVKEGEFVTPHGSIVEASTWHDLYEYQREGVKWMWELYMSGGGTGGILGDEMGLGKTVQLCTHYSSIANEEISRQQAHSLSNMNSQKPLLLVVCPATVQQHWLQEFHKWAPRLRVVILHSISPTFSALSSMGHAAIKRAINKISQSTEGNDTSPHAHPSPLPPPPLSPRHQQIPLIPTVSC
jgi:SNF2 family DNA or RNA helicase